MSAADSDRGPAITLLVPIIMLKLVIFLIITLTVKYVLWFMVTNPQRIFGREDIPGPAEQKKLYLLGVFQLAGYVGRDINVDTPGRNRVVAEYIRRLTGNGENTELCINAFNTGLSPNYQVTSGIRFIRASEKYSGKRVNLGILMNFIVTLALSDGILTDREKARLQEIAALLNYPSSKLTALLEECNIMKEWQSFRDSEYGNFTGSYSSSSGGSGYRDGFSGNGAYGESFGQGSSYSDGSYYDSGFSGTGENSGTDSGGSWNRDSSSGYTWQESQALRKAFEILGVPENASPRDIKRAYHRMIRKYHPDMIKARGLPEEMSQIYADRAQEINDAYTLITRNRGDIS